MQKKITVLGVPCYLGLGDRKGNAHGGPDAILEAGLLHALRGERYDVSYRNVMESAEYPEIFDSTEPPRGKVHFEKHIAGVIALTNARAFGPLLHGHQLLSIGGDHAYVPGTIGAALAHAKSQEKTLGLIWIDAHADIHTDKTTHSHHANGMPLAATLGKGSRKLRAPIGYRKISPKHVLHVGLGTADCEVEELEAFQKHRITSFSQERLSEVGYIPLLNALFDLRDKVDYIWVSCDLDAINEAFAPGVSFQNKTGLHPNNVLWLIEEIRKTGKLLGADIVEYNRANEWIDARGRGITAMLAVEIAKRLFHQPSLRNSFIAGEEDK